MIALCKCGLDMSEHGDIVFMPDEQPGDLEHGHAFDASGTKHPCEKRVDGYLCPMPFIHYEYDVPCGPLTGEKLWD